MVSCTDDRRFAQAAKPKSTAGWVFAGLSFIPLFGIWFGIVAIVIGAVKKTTGQVYLGIAGILFSVLLYGGIFYFGFIAKTGPFAELKLKQVPQMIKTDAGQIALYKSQHGKLPEALADLGNPSEKTLFFTTDPWGTKFKYTKLGDEHFELTSAGPDGEFGTSDDITETF
jgi:Type II secretion system (T2SS), protein G